MKITRKDALTILNACFSQEIFKDTYALDARGFEQTFMIARMQLITAIILNYNNSIWQQFVIDPVKFVEKYKHSDVLIKSINSVLSDFLMNASIKESNHHFPEQNDTQNELEGNRSTPKSILSGGSFYDFWNTCCDIASIHIKKRNDAGYNTAKLDAFIYYNALSRLFGNQLGDWKEELLNSHVEIYTWDELERSIDPTGTSSSNENFLDSGIESNFFKCTLFTKTMSRYFPIIGTFSTDNSSTFFEIYTSILFYPTSKKVKDITTTILVEQTNAIHTINSDKNFWGSEWVDADPNEILKKVANYIDINNQNIKEIYSTRSEDKIPEPYLTAVRDLRLIEDLGNGTYAPLMSLENMLDAWSLEYYNKTGKTLLHYCKQFRKTIVHPLNHRTRPGMPYSERGWNIAIGGIIWEDYED